VRCVFLAFVLATICYAQNQPAPDTPERLSASAPANKAAASTDHVVLKVGGVQVTEAEFEASIKDFEPEKQANTVEDRRKFGDDYASVLMLSQQAVADHLESDPEVRRQLEIARIQTLSNAAFAELMRQSMPSSAEISQYYSDHQADYDEVQIRRLFIWKQGEKAKDGRVLSTQDARERAEKVRQAVASGKDVKTVAQELKDSDTGLFDIEPLTFPRGELPVGMEKVAFGLEKGGWGEVTDGHDSLMLVQLVNRDRRPLAEVSSRISEHLQAEKSQAKLDDLRKKAGIWMDEKYFGTGAAGSTAASGPQPKLQMSAAGNKENQNEGQAEK